MDIKSLQEEVNRRWELQLNNPCHQSADANHALIHIMKAVGKVASALNDAQHEKRDVRADEVQKYLSDIVICSVRVSNRTCDLDAAVAQRLAEKFPVG